MAVGLLLLTGFAFSWIGAAIGLAIRNVEAVQSAGLIWLFPLIFASSAFVPTSTMPAGLRAFAQHQPITYIVDATRGWMLGTPVGNSGWYALAWTRRHRRRVRAAVGAGVPASGRQGLTGFGACADPGSVHAPIP